MPTPDTMFDHRITRAVTAATDRFEALPADKQTDFDQAATLDLVEWTTLGDRPSRGLLAGILTADEAQALHAIHTGWVDATACERFVFIKVCAELMKAGA